jgi:hypothetical protein
MPAPLADDDEDVSWALTTATVHFKRGELADARRWLRRASDRALEIGNTARASELEQAATALAERPQPARPPDAPSAAEQDGPAPSVRAILDSIHETLEEAASQGLITDRTAGAAPLAPDSDKD